MLVGILIGSVGILIGSVGILIGSVGILIHWYFEHWYFERWYFEPLPDSHNTQLISLRAKMAIDRPVSWGLSGPIATSASRSSKDQTSVHTRTMSH